VKKIYQRDWFGINFSDFFQMDNNSIADEKFYSKFYKIFYDKFSSYDDLDEGYKKDKINIAKDLIEFSKEYSKILSIGSGNGIIEDYITKNTNKTVLAIEPSDNSRWLKGNKKCKLVSGFFPECIQDEDKYEIGYCSSIDYIFDDKQYVNFFRSIYDYGFKEFYLTEVIVPNSRILGDIKDYIKNFLAYCGIKRYAKGQFWGYLREIEEHINLLSDAGFKDIVYGQHKHKTYYIRVKNEKN
jgi:methyltransferase type 12